MCRVSSNLAEIIFVFTSASVRVGDKMDGYDSVLLDTSRIMCGEGRAPEITFCYEVCEIRRTRKHIFCWLQGSTTSPEIVT